MYFEKRESKKAKKGYTWCVKFYYTDLNGLKKRYSKSGFETKAAAEQHGREMLEELQQTGRKPEQKTLRDIWEEWKAIKADKLAPATIDQYSRMLKVVPFMDRPIRSLCYSELQAFFNGLANQSKSRNNGLRAVLSNLFKLAKKSGYIVQNPMSDIEISGKEKAPQKDALSLSDIESICDAIEESTCKPRTKKNLQTFLYIGYYTGLRISEILALEVKDFDSVSCTLDIHKKVERKTGIITSRMKTNASYAVLPVCSSLCEILKDHCRNKQPADLILSNLNGTPYDQDNVRKVLSESAASVGIPDFHPHMLRHAFITNIIRSGADPKTAAQLARHSDISTTLNIYTQMNMQDLSMAVQNAFTESPKKDPNQYIFSA